MGRQQRDNGTHAGTENGFGRVILLMEGGPVIPHGDALGSVRLDSLMQPSSLTRRRSSGTDQIMGAEKNCASASWTKLDSI